MIMRVKELKEIINRLDEEIMCDGEGIASHNIPSDVSFWVENDESDYELVSIEPTILTCGCWDGIRFLLRRK